MTDPASVERMHTTLPAPLLRRPGVLPRGARSLLFQSLDLRRTRRSDSAAPATTSRARSATRASIVTRDDRAAIHALFNVCRHRGTRLCEQTEGHFVDRIQCPYHAWTYDLDGRLLAAPHMAPDFCKEDYPLHRAGCEVWDGHIFVHLGRRTSPTTARRSARRQLPICPIASPPGAWTTSVSAGASSTTSRPTGS